MCGICGYQAAEVEEIVLDRMNARLVPRGPDEAGRWRDGGVGLAMRRLAVIDVAGGHQPMVDETGRVRLVHNGEIYNYRALRDELVALGHRFATDSDTEVLVHGYEAWGPDLVHRLDGMFVFAVFDARDGSWFLARDRMGQKPLYYVHRPDLFAFASEPKALLEHPAIGRRLDPAALASYLVLEYVPAPQSIFEGIRKLPPGHRMRVRGDRLEIERWWTLPGRAEAEAAEDADGGRPRDDAGWVRRLRQRLGDAVERQLVADVPLGCFLSGGLDSSAVAVLMAERLPRGRLQTFAIGFTDSSFDESTHAAAVARTVGSEHHVRMLDAETLLDLLPEVTGFMDEPLGDGSVLPTYALARFARRHVTVALSGDGGDELLGGYPTLFADRWAERYARLVPEAGHRALSAAVGRLPVSLRDMSPDFKIRQFLRAARRPSEERHFGWVGSFLPEELPALLVPELHAAALGASPFDAVRRELADGPRREGLDRLLFLYARFYLGDDVLTKVDRATMAASLEARAPFLDPAFIRFAAALPPALKVRGRDTKVALRRAFDGALPANILRRPKKGFGMPVGLWLKGPLRPTLEHYLARERIARQGLFAPAYIERLVREHLAGTRDHRKPLWTLLAFQLWHERHLEAV